MLNTSGDQPKQVGVTTLRIPVALPSSNSKCTHTRTECIVSFFSRFSKIPPGRRKCRGQTSAVDHFIDAAMEVKWRAECPKSYG